LQTKGMQLAAPPTSNIVCFRPPGSDDAAVMALQQRLRDAGVAFFSTPTWRGQRWLRSVILNPFVDESRLQAIVDAL